MRAKRVFLRPLVRFGIFVAAAGLLFNASFMSEVFAAPIGGERVAVLSPFTSGVTTGSESPSTHNALNSGFGFAWDMHGGAGIAVYPRVTTSDGTVALRVVNIYTRDAGSGVDVQVKVDGTVVGTLRYSHLVNLGVSNNTDINTGTRLGDTAPNENIGDCKGFKCSNSWQVKTTAGIHTHMEFSRACYGSQTTNTSVNATTGLALLSQHYGTTNRTACDATELSQAASGGVSSSTTLAQPAAITYNGALNVFIRGNDGQIYTQYWNGTNWSGYSSLGGSMASDPAVIENAGALNVFARGTDGQIYTKYSDNSGWTGWASMGSQTMRGNPTVIHYGTEMDVFALGTDNHPCKNTWNSTSGWGGWTSLGNYMDSSPAALQYGSELSVIMRGGDNQIYKKTWNGSGWGGFDSLESPSGGAAGNPDVLSYAGQLEIWTNTAQNKVTKRTWNGSSWSSWTEMGSGFAGDVDIIQFNNDLNVFARGTDGQIYNRYWSASGQYWSGWASIDTDTPAAGDPTVIQYGTELDVFVIGPDGKTYKNTFHPTSGWGGFTSLPN